MPCGLAQHDRVGFDRAEPAPQLDPESRVGARDMVAAQAVSAVLGDPALGDLHEVLLDAAAAGVELGQGDDVEEAAVVVRPLPEAIEVGGVAAAGEGVAKEMMAATR